MAPTENEAVADEKTDRELLIEYIGSNASALDKLTAALAALAAPPVLNVEAIRIAKLEKFAVNRSQTCVSNWDLKWNNPAFNSGISIGIVNSDSAIGI